MLCSLLVRLRRGLALLALVTLALGLAGCEKPAPLTDEDVVKYIAATKAIRAVSPELADKLGKKDAAPEEGQAGFDKIDGAVKAAGFGSYADFVQVNAAIAVNFSAAQATLFMADQDDAMKKGNAQVDQALNDPNVPEATKVQLRAQMAQANEQYTKDKGFADKVMGWIKPMQDDASMAVIKKHRVELQAAMSGVAMPTEAATAPVPPAPSTPATPPTAIADKTGCVQAHLGAVGGIQTLGNDPSGGHSPIDNQVLPLHFGVGVHGHYREQAVGGYAHPQQFDRAALADEHAGPQRAIAARLGRA